MASEQTTVAAVKEAVTTGVLDAAHSKSNDLKPSDTAAVAALVVKQVAPVVLNATNNEPWYQSRVTIGNYVAIGATIVGPLIGHTFPPEEQALITAAITGIGVVVGAAYSLYGRWKAKKPIGS